METSVKRIFNRVKGLVTTGGNMKSVIKSSRLVGGVSRSIVNDKTCDMCKTGKTCKCEIDTRTSAEKGSRFSELDKAVNIVSMNHGITRSEVLEVVEHVKSKNPIREYIHDGGSYYGCLLAYKDDDGVVRIGFSSCDPYDIPGGKELASTLAMVSSKYYNASESPIPSVLSVRAIDFVARCSCYFRQDITVKVYSPSRKCIVSMTCSGFQSFS